MKTTYPKEPILDFNEWMLYIKNELEKIKFPPGSKK